jgi:hypothetical protein
MKFKQFIAAAFSVAFVAMPIYAGAAEEGGTVCGRVNVPSPVTFQLDQVPNNENIIVARSQSEDVQAPVNIDGSYCFKNLHTDVHTIVAFEDAFQTQSATVTPVAGQTLIVDLTGGNAGL